MKDESEVLVSVEPNSALDVHRQATRDYARASKASATWRAYRTDLDDFAAWCNHHSVKALPAAPETVAAYPARSRPPAQGLDRAAASLGNQPGPPGGRLRVPNHIGDRAAHYEGHQTHPCAISTRPPGGASGYSHNPQVRTSAGRPVDRQGLLGPLMKSTTRSSQSSSQAS
jgi:hypothetical protein